MVFSGRTAWSWSKHAEGNEERRAGGDPGQGYEGMEWQGKVKKEGTRTMKRTVWTVGIPTLVTGERAGHRRPCDSVFVAPYSSLAS